MSRAKRVRKARSAARRARRYARVLTESHAFLTEATERARFRRKLNESDVSDAVKTVLGALVDPVGFVVDKMRELVCPHCLGNNISASLQKTVTARGEVRRCWQCGGEYVDGVRVWPEPPGVLQPRVDSPETNRP